MAKLAQVMFTRFGGAGLGFGPRGTAQTGPVHMQLHPQLSHGRFGSSLSFLVPLSSAALAKTIAARMSAAATVVFMFVL